MLLLILLTRFISRWIKGPVFLRGYILQSSHTSISWSCLLMKDSQDSSSHLNDSHPSSSYVVQAIIRSHSWFFMYFFRRDEKVVRLGLYFLLWWTFWKMPENFLGGWNIQLCIAQILDIFCLELSTPTFYCYFKNIVIQNVCSTQVIYIKLYLQFDEYSM